MPGEPEARGGGLRVVGGEIGGSWRLLLGDFIVLDSSKWHCMFASFSAMRHAREPIFVGSALK